MNKLIMLTVLVASLAIGAYGVQSVFAQEEGTVAGIVFSTDQMLIVIVLGIGAGFLTAYQGYRTTKNDWDTLKFFDGVIMAVLGSVPLAIGSALQATQLGVFEYVMIFFASLGIGMTINRARKKTVGSNEVKAPGT